MDAHPLAGTPAPVHRLILWVENRSRNCVTYFYFKILTTFHPAAIVDSASADPGIFVIQITGTRSKELSYHNWSLTLPFGKTVYCRYDPT